MSACDLISVNIEGDRHFSRLFPFLEAEAPDVVCLQEVFQEDFEEVKRRFGMEGIFMPMTRRPRGNLHTGEVRGGPILWGVGIMTRLPIASMSSTYYSGEGEDVPLFEWGNVLSYRRVLVSVTVRKEEKEFHFLNTHFTWTPDGLPSDTQRADMERLLDLLSKRGEFVLCGDLNAPRGGDIFQCLAGVYTDNIPPSITTTIDGSLHRSGELPYVVDGLFSTSRYTVEGVEVRRGVSDHCAIIARIVR